MGEEKRIGRPDNGDSPEEIERELFQGLKEQSIRDREMYKKYGLLDNEESVEHSWLRQR